MKEQIINDLTVTDIADEGKAVAKHEGKVIFIDKGVPGDVVDVRITRKKRSYVEAKIIATKVRSPLRTTPFCQHFEVCGGCKWQHLEYEAQIQFKQKQAEEALRRIGKVTEGMFLPILPSANTQYYRNKLEYTFSDKRWLTTEEFQNNTGMGEPALGFHIPGMFDKVLDIKKCYLQPDLSNQIRLTVRNFAIENNIPFFGLKNQTGILRNLIIRNTSVNEWMVIVVFSNEHEKRAALLDYLFENVKGIASLMYVINTKRNDTIFDQQVHLYKGIPYITEEMEGLKFRIGPTSFFQTNSAQAYELYKITRDFAELTGQEIVYDLYTGTGTIANFVASKAKKVIGVEFIEAAIEDAKINSELNNISNTFFCAGDMKNILTNDFFNQHGKPDVIITDPPRAGMHEDVTKMILHSGAHRIVYVSCNAATQARDINLLSEKYSLVKSQPVDMFPHTHHVENVALLKLKS